LRYAKGTYVTPKSDYVTPSKILEKKSEIYIIMPWYMYIFWFIIMVMCINIAFQIYYGNADISRVDQIKTGMKRANSKRKFETDIQKKLEKKENNHLGIYSTLSQYVKTVFQAVETVVQYIVEIVFSIISPKLYSIIG
jgi:type II secretory pathway component PulC